MFQEAKMTQDVQDVEQKAHPGAEPCLASTMTQLPSKEQLREISAKQEAKEKDGREAKTRQAAAELIQRNYRGYKFRRALKGYSLSSSERWIQACRSCYAHIFCLNY